jgi:AraC-like DNA-binding protein
MRQAQEWLREGKRSVKHIAFALGYKHPNNFSRAFKAYQGRGSRKS